MLNVKLIELRFELLLHPPYFPNKVPNDYWLFVVFKKLLQGKDFGSKEKVIADANFYFQTKDKSFCKKGINHLEERFSAYVTLQREYIDK